MTVKSISLNTSWKSICKVSRSQCGRIPRDRKKSDLLYMPPNTHATRILLPDFSREACFQVVEQADVHGKSAVKIWYGFTEDQVDSASWGPPSLADEECLEKRIVLAAKKMAPDNWVLTYTPPDRKDLRTMYTDTLLNIFAEDLSFTKTLLEIESKLR